MKREHPPLALTIAGSDSGGGAGIQADLKTFQAFGVFGTSVITAVTAQNTVGVSHAHPIPDAIVEGQIDSVATDLRPESFKTGMLATRGVVEVVEAAIRSHRLPAYVLDPVMVATSGDRLLDRRAEGAMRDLLLPRAAVVTPNVQEAEVLTGISISSVKEMGAAARALVDLGAGAALVKGGHLDGDVVADLLWDGSAERIWRRPRLRTGDTHGTGCTLSAAIAAALAHGTNLHDAVALAIDFVVRAIAAAPGLGQGHGPLSHWVGTRFFGGRDRPGTG